jgi:hypothetical protein
MSVSRIIDGKVCKENEEFSRELPAMMVRSPLLNETTL